MKDMNDKLYCPKCNQKTEFVIKEVVLRLYDYPQDETERVRIIMCSKCELPIGSYTENILETEQNSKS
jgi:hypothetical protein